MREIKFRIWQKNYRKMLSIFKIEWENGKIKYITIDNGKNTAPRYSSYGFKGWELDNLIIMQYTGLKDKNGKEIYEGDIIRRSYPVGYTLYIVKFGFYENGEILENYISGYGWYLDKIKEYNKKTQKNLYNKVPYQTTLFPSKFKEFEITGTIYENPELLKGEWK